MPSVQNEAVQFHTIHEETDPDTLLCDEHIDYCATRKQWDGQPCADQIL